MARGFPGIVSNRFFLNPEGDPPPDGVSLYLKVFRPSAFVWPMVQVEASVTDANIPDGDFVRAVLLVDDGKMLHVGDMMNSKIVKTVWTMNRSKHLQLVSLAYWTSSDHLFWSARHMRSKVFL